MASDWNFDFEGARGSFQGGSHPEWGGRSPAPGSDSPRVVLLRKGGLWEAHFGTKNPEFGFKL